MRSILPRDGENGLIISLVFVQNELAQKYGKKTANASTK